VVRLDAEVAACVAACRLAVDEVAAMDLGAAEPHELLDLVDRTSRSLGERFAIALVNEVFAQQLFDLTGKLLDRWIPDRTAMLELDLFCAREAEVRARAEATIRARLGVAQRTALELVLSGGRRSVRHGRNLRLWRGLSHGMFKRIYEALGAGLAAAGLLDLAGDVHFLTRDEVSDAVRGAAATRDLRARVALRRAGYAPFAERLPEAAVRGGVLRGIGCGPGRTRARARVVLDPTSERDLRGEVLVARTTDPGWVSLMAAAAGIVVENGSLPCHAAITGRELGIPTVVGVRDATRRLVGAGGEAPLVELDGAAGTVRVVAG
jgi:pyruvate,water dikinase